MVTTDRNLYPCDTARTMTVSLAGIKPATVSLSMPICCGSVKEVLHRKDGIVEVTASKAIKEIWPDDVVAERFRWNADHFEPWKEISMVLVHLDVQFRWIPSLGFSLGPGREGDALTKVREIIRCIFTDVVRNGIVRFKLLINKPTGTKVKWYIRAHLPVVTSPVGTPLILLSALDCHEDECLRRVDKRSERETVEELERIFNDEESREVYLESSGELRHISFILLVNSTKMRPTSWQKENLPHGAWPVWLATFLRPLYLEFNLTEKDFKWMECTNCRKDTSANPKRCAKCEVPYCSVECQRADWPRHKTSCFRA